jgi:hypothetical protein
MSLALIASGGKDGGLLSLKILIMSMTRNNSASQRTQRKVHTAERTFYKEDALPTAVVELERISPRGLNII